jgi:transcriptional regulator with XRE-family HTH domain
MTKKTLGSLGVMVKRKRGERRLRETAQDIGIGPATLMRIENGRIPDVTTFGKICRWLDVDPRNFLGFDSSASTAEEARLILVSAHLKADQTPSQETATALAKMILYAARAMAASKGVPGDADV